MVALLALFAGCSPEPASIKFDGPATVTVHSTDAVEVAKATVMDKDGKALETQPMITWSVTPPAVAKLEGTKITPIANGDATVQAMVGEVKGSYKFQVALPDKIEIAGYTAGQAWPADQTELKLTATVKAGDAAIDGQKIDWSSSDETVATVKDGTVTRVAPDKKATITAKSGALTASVEVSTSATAAATADASAPAPAAPAAPAK
jgi:hypothetical protein